MHLIGYFFIFTIVKFKTRAHSRIFTPTVVIPSLSPKPYCQHGPVPVHCGMVVWINSLGNALALSLSLSLSRSKPLIASIIYIIYTVRFPFVNTENKVTITLINLSNVHKTALKKKKSYLCYRSCLDDFEPAK